MRPVALALAALALAGCAYPVRNYPIDPAGPKPPYRMTNLPPAELADTLVIVTASGGGTRAAALTMATLRAMADIALPTGKHLSDEVDVISSVSGGSVTAADFALYGVQGFPTLERDFIRKDGIGRLLWAELNPLGLAQLSTNGRERIDPLIDYFDDALFHGKTLGDLVDGRRHPYLVLNAADMVEGMPFAFTQDTFDLICSDAARTKLATAVAASAAFPVALSPVTLKNYSPCPAHGANWRPVWAKVATETDTSKDQGWYDNPALMSRARLAMDYAAGNSAQHPKRYIHLLDGGIADNLGVTEPYRMLATTEVKPSYLNAIAGGTIRKIVFVMINARSQPLSPLDGTQATPGIVDMLLGTINSGIDRTTFGNAQMVRALLTDTFKDQARQAAANGDADAARNFKTVADNTFLIPVDFDAIADPGCRLAYHSMSTSWTLGGGEIDALIKIGPALFGQSPDFAPAMTALGGRPEHGFASVDDVCKGLPAKL